jgi:structure-specific endonuclease subunit SLX4 (BTB/POZ domain-containing protein 12)
MLECKNTSVLISPEKSQPIDLTQSKPDHLSSGSQDPPSRVNKEVEIILLLDSDEELELAQAKTKSASHDPPEERNILEVSPKSTEERSQASTRGRGGTVGESGRFGQQKDPLAVLQPGQQPC